MPVSSAVLYTADQGVSAANLACLASCSAMTANHRDFVAAPPTCTPPPQHWKLPGIELVEASASQPQTPARTLLSQQKVVAYLFHLLGDHLLVDHHTGSWEDVGAS